MIILLIVYTCVGYWAVGRTVWADKVIFGSVSGMWMHRVKLAILFGWILIPWAIIKTLLGR